MRSMLPTNATLVCALCVLCSACNDAPTASKHAIPVSSTAQSEPVRLAPVGEFVPVLSGVCAEAVVNRNDVAYVASIDGISIFRTTRTSIEKVGHIATLGRTNDLALVGTTLYVADGLAGLTTLTIDIPDKPQVIKNTNFGTNCTRVSASPRGVAVLCSEGTMGLLRTPDSLERLQLAGEPRDAEFVKDHLYVASAGDGLLQIDVDSTPARITYRDRSLHRIISLTSADSRLFVGLRDKRILALDVSTETPRILGETAVPNRPTRLAVHGNRLLVASNWPGDTGGTWVDILPDGSLRVAQRLAFTVTAGTHVDADRWLVARRENGLSLIDGDVTAHVDGVRFERLAVQNAMGIVWSDSATRVRVWPTDDATSLRVSESAQVADAVRCGNAYCILDTRGQLCRRSASPTADACVDVPGEGASLSWQADTNTAWVLDGNANLHGVKLDENMHIGVTVAHPPLSATPNFNRVSIDGHRAVAMDPLFAALQIIDLDAVPRWRGRFLLHARPSAIALVGNFAFVAEPSAGLQVVDISNPDKPREAAWLPFRTGPFGIAARGSTATVDGFEVFVAEGEMGVSMWSWTVNGQWTRVRQSDTPGFATDLVLDGNDLWVADATHVGRFDVTRQIP